MRHTNGIFIAGTDTEIGKTIITASLAATLLQKNLDIGVWKPVQSGARAIDIESDASRIKALAGLEDAPHEIAPLSFVEPVTPHLAAIREGTILTLPGIIQAGELLFAKHKNLLVEGAGGLLAPLTDTKLGIDLIKQLGFSVLLVARGGLGTINHTLLSIEALRTRAIPILGVILNQTEAALSLTAIRKNADYIEDFGKVPVLGLFPYLAEPITKNQLIEVIEKHIQLTPILREFQD
ncbi:dethiobiotin synthase [Brevibacillus laterosporus]|uniref:ATP-dependent dethiobiotin synthetase BioD n=1 Tax=Brevibacillus laterosporus LMG 15441 TaxID=1042163 RepID=A0A075R474_BRELA|nr:dethiobiotin synthase [Brevibacillus laterosporus]AIG24435.1 ATP-dependent dethiobiotin synthetase BioD [Brevibacillus laterosporus LMG 15441]RJL08123.1 dethiobiotin synthase [Brevibacillus laterosporus]TPH19139.1 dethiobiotin synthase [Brevibacillus laterosporus]CCF16089.1 dethiobiotin synthase [Brevibacillus laterosporus GI-9]